MLAYILIFMLLGNILLSEKHGLWVTESGHLLAQATVVLKSQEP